MSFAVNLLSNDHYQNTGLKCEAKTIKTQGKTGMAGCRWNGIKKVLIRFLDSEDT